MVDKSAVVTYYQVCWINYTITITTNQTLITDKTITGNEKKTYLLHPNYEKTTLSVMQHKHHVH